MTLWITLFIMFLWENNSLNLPGLWYPYEMGICVVHVEGITFFVYLTLGITSTSNLKFSLRIWLPLRSSECSLKRNKNRQAIIKQKTMKLRSTFLKPWWFPPNWRPQQHVRILDLYNARFPHLDLDKLETEIRGNTASQITLSSIRYKLTNFKILLWNITAVINKLEFKKSLDLIHTS